MIKPENVSGDAMVSLLTGVQTELNDHLRRLLYAIDATSAWICYFDFTINQATVCGGYARPEANPLEQISDVGEHFYEQSGDFVRWLASRNPTPQMLHIDELSRDDKDWEDYVRQGAHSVAFVPIILNNETWGYLEVWESRYRREFSKVSLARARLAAEHIGELIAAELNRL